FTISNLQFTIYVTESQCIAILLDGICTSSLFLFDVQSRFPLYPRPERRGISAAIGRRVRDLRFRNEIQGQITISELLSPQHRELQSRFLMLANKSPDLPAGIKVHTNVPMRITGFISR